MIRRTRTPGALRATARRLSEAASAAGWSMAAAAAPEPSLEQVVGNVRAWLLGMLVGLATLALLVAGVLRILSGGDPTMIDRSRLAFRGALLGYALALLAPVFLALVRGLVSG